MDEKAEALKKDKLLREMKRKANDEIRVFNPTNEDYEARFDGLRWVIPAKDRDIGYGKGDNVVPRYVAKNYFTHMIDKLIMEESDKLMAADRKKFGDDSWEYSKIERRKALKTNNPELRKKYFKILWKGVEREFGVDEVAQEEIAPRSDARPLDEQLMDEVENEGITPVEAPLYTSKKDQAKEEFAKEIV